ncbi:MAG: PilZ domain-containing protein [Candidatus Eremiobacteraeota bacterium]|nr:PilZ domain-containing protein [Candidatus Eremiobacteraeota bacterium]
MSDRSDPASLADEKYERRYVRVDVAIDVTYAPEGSDVVRNGFSCDLGGGGFRLSTDEDLPLGTTLWLRFRVPDAEREIAARGRIVLSFYNAEDRRFMHGVAFTQIDRRDQDRIVEFVVTETKRQALR